MRFSEYMRQREEEEEKEKQGGYKFSDYLRANRPEYYETMQQKKQQKANDYLNRVNSSVQVSNMKLASTDGYISKNKDTYLENAGEQAKANKASYEPYRESTLSLMKEAWQTDIDNDTREKALDIMRNQLRNYQVAGKKEDAFAEYMQQFPDKEHFDKAKEKEKNQASYSTMDRKQLEERIAENKDKIKAIKRENMQGFYGDAKDQIDALRMENSELSSRIFQENKSDALNSLTPEVSEILEKYYEADNASKALQFNPKATYTARMAAQKSTLNALKEQGIDEQEFEKLYEYYKFNRDEENTKKMEDVIGATYHALNPKDKKVGTLLTSLTTPLRGVLAIPENVRSLTYQDKNAPVNTNSLEYALTNATDSIRENASDEIRSKYGNTADFLFQTGMSIADMAATLPLDTVMPGTSLAVMGSNAATEASKEATLRGLDKKHALLTGTCAGIAEVVFEKLSLDHFWKIAKKQGKAATRNAFMNVITQAGIEGSEEVATDLANTFTDNLINNGLSEYYQNMNNYYMSGMSTSEARKRADIDYAKQLGLSFLGGAISGGIFGGVGTAKTIAAGKNSDISLETMSEISEGLDLDRDNYDSEEDYNKVLEAKKLSDELTKNGKVSAFEKGLYEQAINNLTTIKPAKEDTLLNITENDSNELRKIKELAVTLDNETVAKAFVSDYKEGYPVDIYTRAFNNFYKSAMIDMPFDKVMEANGMIASVIHKNTLYEIYTMGMNQAKILHEANVNKEQIEAVQQMAKMVGVKVEFTDKLSGANGMLKNNVIHISNQSNHPAMVVFSHELTHSLKTTAAEDYHQYEDFVIDYLKNNQPQQYQKIYDSIKSVYKTADESLIREEIAANASETFMTDASFVENFATKNPSLAQRIYDFFEQFIAKLKKLYQNYRATSKTGKALAEDITAYETARDLWYKAVKTSTQKQDAENVSDSDTESKEQISLKDYDLWDKKNPRVSFVVSKVSEPLVEVGIDENRKILFDSKKIIKIKNDHAEMTDDVIKNIDQIIQNPIAIMNSASVPGRLTMVGELEADNGVPVMIALELHPTNKKGIEIDEIKICSAYARNNFISWMKNQDYLWINPDKNKTNNWLKRTRVQFPVGISQYGLIKSIAQKEQNGKQKEDTSHSSYDFEKVPPHTPEANHDTVSSSETSVSQNQKKKNLAPSLIKTKKRSLATAIDEQASIDTSETASGTALSNSINENSKKNNQKMSLKEYSEEIGLRFSDKEDTNLFDTDEEERRNQPEQAAQENIQTVAKLLETGMDKIRSLKKAKLSKEMCAKIVSRYAYEYNTSCDRSSLYGNVYNIFDYMYQHEDADYKDMLKLLQEVCRPIVEHASVKDSAAKEEYTALRKLLNGYHIQIDEEQQKRINEFYGSFDKFRILNKDIYHFPEDGTYEGTYLSNIWNKIVETSGNITSDTDVKDQLLTLHQHLEMLRKKSINPTAEMNQDAISQEIALNIINDYFRYAARYNNKTLQSVRDDLKKEIKSYDSNMKKGYKLRYEDALEKEKLDKASELDRAKKYLSKLHRELDKYEIERDYAICDYLHQEIREQEKKIEIIKERNVEQIADYKAEHTRSSVEKAFERQRSTYANRIRRNVADLQNRLNNPSENKFVPRQLVLATVDLCEAINLDTGRSEKMAEKLTLLHHLYGEMKVDEDYAKASEYDDHTKASIERLQFIFSDRDITRLTTTELQEVDELVAQIHHQVVNAGKLLREGQSKDAYEMAEKAIEEINASVGRKNNELGKFVNKYETFSLNANRMFRRMSGYKTNSVLEQLGSDLNEGQHKQMQVLMETARIFDSVLEGKQNQKAVRNFTGKEKKNWIDLGLTYKDQSPVMVPKAFRVSLAMHIQNKANLDHIIYGGLTIPEMNAYMKGDYSEAYKTGRTVRFIPEGLSREERQEYYKAAKEKLLAVTSDMTLYEKQFLKLSEKFFHEYTGEKINETSLLLNGYKKARVHNYFPIRTDSNYTHADFQSLVYNATLECLGMLEHRVNARNPILLEDVTMVIERQSKNVAKYYGLAIPVRNFKKVYMTTMTEYRDSVKHAINAKWGEEGEKYIENLLVDLESSRKQEGTFFDKLKGNFAGAALSMNIGVTIKQAASFPTAAYVLGWDAINHALPEFAHKADMELIAKYTPLLWYRNQGNATQELADVKRIGYMENIKARLPEGLDKIPDGLMNWIQNMDTKTVSVLWKASEYYVTKNNKVLKPNTDAYYKEVAKVFNKCVEETQPNYTVMQRPELLRNPDKLYQALSMFKTQLMQNFGIVYDATMNLHAKRQALKQNSNDATVKSEYESAVEEFARAISSQLVSAAVISAMTFLGKAIIHKMDKYRDEEGELDPVIALEVFMEDMVGSMAGMFIGGNELYTFLRSVVLKEKYYGIEVSPVAAVSDLFMDITKYTANFDSKYIKNIVFDLSTLAGIPTQNAYNLLAGIGLHAEDALNGEFLSFNAGYEPTRNMYYSRLLHALVDEDKQEYDKQYQKALQSIMITKDEETAKKTINSGMKNKLKKMYLDGEVSQSQTEQLLKELGVEEKDIYFTIEKWENSEDNDYDKYNKLEQSIKADTNVKEQIDYLTEHGVDEETVKNKVKSIIKESYKNGTITEKQTREYLREYWDMEDENDIYWKLREWNSSAEEYGQYDDLLTAFENGNFKSALKEYTDHGIEASQVKNAFKGKYKKLYIDAYLKGDHKKVDDIKVKLNTLTVNGKRLFGANDYLAWNKEADKTK